MVRRALTLSRRILGQKTERTALTRKSSMEIHAGEESISPSPIEGRKGVAEDEDTAILTPPLHKKVALIERNKTPRFGHLPAPLMDKTRARPPFVDARKGPNAKRFEVIETGDLMSKNKKVPCFSIQRMSPRKPMNVREHFMQDYHQEDYKSINSTMTKPMFDLNKMSDRGRRLSIYDQLVQNPEPDNLTVQKCYLNLGKRSPKLDLSKQSPRDDKIYTNTEMYRNALRENQIFDEIKEYLFDGDTLQIH